ncbi:MAG: AraC family transcriptional regulator [Pseudomonadota bacterium]
MPFKTSLDEPVVPVRDITRHSVFSTLIQAFIESDGMGGRMRAEALIDLVLHDICVQLESRNLQMNTNTISRPVLKKVQDFVEVNLADEIKIDDLAEIADMSVFHFSRMFRNSKGMAPYQFVTQRRIAKAQHLLATTADDIACIANATGFSSQSHLTSTFKKLIGMTPRNFRLSQ